jgi:hypothetical protein
MKHATLFGAIALPVLVITLSAQAHEPSQHADADKEPDCAKMKEMDHSKMDKNDPVMQAMMKKCMKKMHKNEPKPGKHHNMHHEHKAHDNASDNNGADVTQQHDHRQ